MDRDTFSGILFLLAGCFLLITRKKQAQWSTKMYNNYFRRVFRVTAIERGYMITYLLCGICWIIFALLVLLGII
jgi:hypothetical protein